MPWFEYRCPVCRSVIETRVHVESVYGTTPNCARRGCPGHTKRVFSFSTTPPTQVFTPHFNWSVGRYVSSRADFDEALKVCTDRASQPRLVEDLQGNTREIQLDHDFTKIERGPAPFTRGDINDMASAPTPTPEPDFSEVSEAFGEVV